MAITNKRPRRFRQRQARRLLSAGGHGTRRLIRASGVVPVSHSSTATRGNCSPAGLTLAPAVEPG